MNNNTMQLEFETYKPKLFAVAYKMTKNVMDSEDILHDVYLSFLNQPRLTIQHLEHYLVKAVINRCLTLIEKQQYIVYPGIDLPMPLLSDGFSYVHKEDVSYALVVLLQKLNPIERAIFILRETFDFDYEEIAEILSLQKDNCRQLLHRAKAKISTDKVSFIPTASQRQVFIDAFLTACTDGNIQEMIEYLKDDIIIYSDGGGKVTAALKPIIGKQHCIAFLSNLYRKMGTNYNITITQINDEYGLTLTDKVSNSVDTVVIFTFEETMIATIYLVRNPDKLIFFK